MSFEQQLAEVRNGDERALDALLTDWRPRLRTMARGALGRALQGRLDTSDLVQDTLLEAARQAASFRGSSEAEWACWVRRILRGRISRTVRRQLAQKRDVRRESPATERVACSRGPLGELILREDALRVERALVRLSPQAQQLIRWRVMQQMPFEEIAQRLGRSSASLRTLWTRSMRQLAAQLAAGSRRESA